MATGRGLSRGLALGLQAAKQFSDLEEAEKDRQLRKEMQEREMTDRQLGRDAAMEQLMARIAAGASSDDKKIQAAANELGLTLESREEIARLGRLLERDKLNQQDQQFLASLGVRRDEFAQMQALRVRAADLADKQLQNDMNQFQQTIAEQIRAAEEAESQGRTRLNQEGNQFDRKQTEIEQARKAMDAIRERQVAVQENVFKMNEANSAVGNNLTRAQIEALRQDTQNNAWSPEVRKVMDLRKLIEQPKREGQAIQDKYGMQILEEPDPFRQQALRDQMQMDLAEHQQSTSRFVQMAENAIADGEKTGRTTYTSRWVPDTNGLGGKLVPQIQTGNLEDFKNFHKQYGSNTDQGNPLGLTKPPVTPQSPPSVIPTTPPPVDPRGKNLTPEPTSPRSESPTRQNMLSRPFRRSQPSSSGPSLFDALWGTGKDKKKIY